MSSKDKGQIQPDSRFGQILVALSKSRDFKHFVEIGTWKGQGSTKCIADALLRRPLNDKSCLWSLESNKEFYEESLEYWAPHLVMFRGIVDKVKLLYGRIVEVDDLLSKEEINDRAEGQEYPYLDWLERNISEYKQAPNIIDELPWKIDVLLLDGGIFSTKAEWFTLKVRTGVVLLDDTTTLKTKAVRENIISDRSWEILIDSDERNGFVVACRTSISTIVKRAIAGK